MWRALRAATGTEASRRLLGAWAAAYSHCVLAIVPVKGRDGKHRLDDLLSPDQRTRLVEAMLADVLAACEAARSVTATLVVTPDRTIVPDGVDVLTDDGTGHAAAIARALADERAHGGALVVMADCPLVRAESLDRLAESANPLALVPANDGGMNAVALRGPVSFAPAFGVPDAAGVTAGRARAAGLEPVVVDDVTLAFDVDTAADVRKLCHHAERSSARTAVAALLAPAGAR